MSRVTVNMARCPLDFRLNGCGGRPLARIGIALGDSWHSLSSLQWEVCRSASPTTD